MTKIRKSNYINVKIAPTATATSDMPIPDEALRARRATVERSMDERVKIDAEPADALKALLAVRPQA